MSTNGSESASELSLHTIIEQQHVITALRKMVSELKDRLAVLESSVPSAANSTATALAEAPAPFDPLSDTVLRLRAERDAAAAKCAALEAEAAQHSEAIGAATQRLRLLQSADDERRALRSVVDLAKVRCREAEGRVQRLEKDLDEAAMERGRWRALAMALTMRVDKVTRERAQLHMQTLDGDERRRAMSTPNRQANAKAYTSPHTLGNMSVRARGGGDSGGPEGAAIDPIDLVDVWDAQRTPLPRVPREVDPAPHSGQARGRAPRGNRYLVPL